MSDPFKPQQGTTLPVLVGVASARVALSARAGAQIELSNSGSVSVFVAFGDVNVVTTVGVAHATAPTAGGYEVGPGICKLVTVNSDVTHMAHISGTAGQTLYVTPGVGA
jgi:hypothetical protein